MRLPAIVRRIPLDVLAFLAITLVMIVGHRSAIRHGMRFDDTSWLFHVGARARDGAHPYRDFVHLGGPLPIYVDALAQRLMGPQYIASLYAALVVRILRVFVIWAIARRLADVPAAIGVAVFCAFDPLLGAEYVTTATYVELFALLAALCAVLAARSNRRILLVAIGLCASLIASASAGAGIVLALLLVVASVPLLRTPAVRPRLGAVWVGVAGGVVLLVAALAFADLLGPALHQIAERAGDANGLDAFTGGTASTDGHTWWGSLLAALGLPVVVVAAIVYLATRPGEVTLETVGQIAIPIGLLVGLGTRFGKLDLLGELPRLFLLATATLAVTVPARLRDWFGIEPLVAVALAGLPLAADLGLGLTGAGDPAALVIGVILLALATTRLSVRAKRRFCAALAAIALVGLYFAPFELDGTSHDNIASSANRHLRGMRLTEARRQVLDWLMPRVPKHSTCFVVGTLPALYTMLDCDNPTRIDSLTVASDDDMSEILTALAAHPPDVLITRTPQAVPFDIAIQGLLVHYELLGVTGDNIEPVDRPLGEKAADHVTALRLYRRRAQP